MREPDHVWNTDLGEYDQVIALTQYMVNESFFNMWTRVRNSKDPEHPLLKFKTGHPRFGSIDVELDAPLVIFNVESAAFNEVVYIMRSTFPCHLPTGHALILWSSRSEPAGSVHHDEISKELPKTGNPTDYSVERLLIDFTSWEDKADLRADFKVLMNRHIDIVKQIEKKDPNAGSTLGFVATVNKPALINGHAPTFVPTSYTFQTYPYFNRAAIGDATGTGKNGVDGTSRFNYFCYRELTDNHAPPTDTYKTNLPIRSIWTTAKVDGRGVPVDRGTFMISRKNFWGNYLLPLLKQYNANMEVICGRPEVSIKTRGFQLDWSWSCGWSYETSLIMLSIGPKPDRNYDWIESGKNAWFYSSFEGENPNKRDRLTDGQVKGYHVEDWTGWLCYSYCRSTTKSWCDTEVSFEPGSNTFTMKGRSGLHFWLQLDDWKDLVETDDMHLECTWSITFTMMSVKDGGLEIQVKADKPILREDARFQLAKYQEGTLAPALTYAKDYFGQSLKNLSSLEANLTKAFASQNKFFFPGAGTYFFEDPAFNHNGDMFCRISYNAAAQAVERSDIKVTSQVLPTDVPTKFEGKKPNDPNAQKKAEEEAAKTQKA
ncbi:MAG: hypothetical protein Q9174_004763 [Haloplaca sp. 1 TL-2023]